MRLPRLEAVSVSRLALPCNLFLFRLPEPREPAARAEPRQDLLFVQAHRALTEKVGSREVRFPIPEPIAYCLGLDAADESGLLHGNQLRCSGGKRRRVRHRGIPWCDSAGRVRRLGRSPRVRSSSWVTSPGWSRRGQSRHRAGAGPVAEPKRRSGFLAPLVGPTIIFNLAYAFLTRQTCRCRGRFPRPSPRATALSVARRATVAGRSRPRRGGRRRSEPTIAPRCAARG